MKFYEKKEEKNLMILSIQKLQKLFERVPRTLQFFILTPLYKKAFWYFHVALKRIPKAIPFYIEDHFTLCIYLRIFH